MLTLEIRRVSKDEWFVDITNEDKRKIACIIDKLKDKTEPLTSYGKWRNTSSEEKWNEILAQFCVMRGTAAWDRLKKNIVEHREFIEKMKLDNIFNQEDRLDFLRKTFRKYKPTILVKKPENEA